MPGFNPTIFFFGFGSGVVVISIITLFVRKLTASFHPDRQPVRREELERLRHSLHVLNAMYREAGEEAQQKIDELEAGAAVMRLELNARVKDRVRARELVTRVEKLQAEIDGLTKRARAAERELISLKYSRRKQLETLRKVTEEFLEANRAVPSPGDQAELPAAKNAKEAAAHASDPKPLTTIWSEAHVKEANDALMFCKGPDAPASASNPSKRAPTRKRPAADRPPVSLEVMAIAT